MAENYYLNHTATQIDAILTKVDGIAAGANVNVQVDWNQTTTTADDYIKNKPTIPDAQIQSDWNQTDTESKDFIKNKPTIPDAQIQSDWNQTDTESKDFIKNKPTIPAAQINSDWNAVSGVAQILNKPAIPDAQIQSDWNQTNTESKDFIKNKPTIPEAQVNSDWSAASGVAQILNKPTLGTAAAKDYTTAVLGLSNDLVTSSAVSTAISTKADLVDGKVPSAQLPSYVDDSIEGYYYEGAFYEDSEHTTAITGETGKIYIDLTANKSYRWTGTVYARIDECPAFGETAGTIYEGNKGKANADAIAAIKDGASIDSFADVENAFTGKADKSTTYTKEETDALVGGKVPKSYYYTTTVSGTSTLEDTGVSYTVPAGDICRVTAAIMYNGSAPQKIRLTFKAMTIAETDAIGSSDITVSASGITAPQAADQVVKVYGQWASMSGTNTVLLLVEKLN